MRNGKDAPVPDIAFDREDIETGSCRCSAGPANDHYEKTMIIERRSSLFPTVRSTPIGKTRVAARDQQRGY
jgi:hypothetical protein